MLKCCTNQTQIKFSSSYLGVCLQNFLSLCVDSPSPFSESHLFLCNIFYVNSEKSEKKLITVLLLNIGFIKTVLSWILSQPIIITLHQIKSLREQIFKIARFENNPCKVFKLFNSCKLMKIIRTKNLYTIFFSVLCKLFLAGQIFISHLNELNRA